MQDPIGSTSRLQQLLGGLRRRGYRWLIVGLTLVPGVKASPTVLERAWIYYKAQDYDRAALEFRKAIAEMPELAEPYAGLGWALYWKGEYLAAGEAFETALGYDTTNALATQGLAAVRKWRYADFNAAWNVYYAGRYAEALNTFQSIIADESGRIPAEDLWQVHSGLGWSAYFLQSYDVAEEAFKRILAIAPNNGYALKGLGFTYYQKGKPKEALEYLSRALSTNPEWADVISMQGWCCYSQRKYDEAKERFEAAIAINPFLADPYYGLGWTAERVGTRAEAKKYFREGISRGPAHPSSSALFSLIDKRRDWWDLYGEYGWAYYQAGLYADAKATFQYGISKLPDDSSLYMGLGFACFRLQQYQEAADNLKYVLSIDPNPPEIQERLLNGQLGAVTVPSDARSLLAWSLYYLGSHEQARLQFERALEAHPGWISLHSGMGWTLLRLGRTKAAAESFRKALEIDPTYVDAQNGLAELRKERYARFNAAWTAYYSGDYDTAAESFQKLAKADDPGVDEEDRWKIYSGLGWSELGRGRAQQALQAFNQASTLSPDNLYVEKGIAMALADLGRQEEALQAIESWIQKYGADAEMLIRQGEIQLALGLAADAAASFDAALALTPGQAKALEGLAEASRLLGDPEKAELYRQAAQRVRAPGSEKTSGE
jgi:tetratricopeptide (TPR) repeat protein